jgi:hypothetical protein
MALPEATVKAWAHAAAVAASDTPLAIKTMLEGVTALPSFLENAGYPKQSKLWMQAIEDTVTVLRPLVPSAERDSLDAILTSAFDRAPDIEAPLPAPRQEKAEEKKPTFTDEQLHRLTEFMLDNSEALQTLRTTVTPHAESQTARVQGIFLSEENRDVPYDFTYSPAMGTVSGIVREGVKLPNTMKLGTFFPSLQKEAP